LNSGGKPSKKGGKKSTFIRPDLEEEEKTCFWSGGGKPTTWRGTKIKERCNSGGKGKRT